MTWYCLNGVCPQYISFLTGAASQTIAVHPVSLEVRPVFVWRRVFSCDRGPIQTDEQARLTI